MTTKNVTLKVKVSQVTNTPASLAWGEMAYSTLSNTLFIGDPTSTPVAIGGAADHIKLAGVATGAQIGTVTSVSGSGAIHVSNGTSTPAITIDAATTSVPGTMSAADKSKLDGIESGAQVNVVLSVAGKTGAVSLVASDISGAAPLASPTFTGTVTVPTPSNSTDAATKGYVDSVALGLDFKESVIAASTANITISTGLTNGTTLDGVTLATGNRVLLKNQTTASENGIYVVVASGAASRSADASVDSEVSKGMFCYVESGTTNGGTAWVLSNKTGSLGTGSLTFTQFGGGATYTAGTGMTLTGTTFSVTNYANLVADGDTLDGGSF